MSALGMVSWGADYEGIQGGTCSGVGLPKVFRKSPFTSFCGFKYIFSKSSGEMETLCAVRMRRKALSLDSSPPKW